MARFALSVGQQATLAAICDTILPRLGALQEEEALSKSQKLPQRSQAELEHLKAYYASCGSDLAVPTAVEAALAAHVPADVQREISLLLIAMSSGLGMLLLSGVAVPFGEMTAEQRARCLQGLQSSVLSQKRKAFLSLKSIIGLKAFGSDASNINPQNHGRRENSMWAALGYEGPASAEEVAGRGREEFVFPMLNATISKDTCLTVDVVVVGSGCGGSVVAAELAQAGRRVLVLEKGRYLQRKEMTSQEGDAFDQMYERGGLVTTDDTGVGVLAGATFGGGSTINWACSLRTPDPVKEEWASQHGLKAFEDGTFDASLDAVCSRLSVKKEGVTHNENNKVLIDGCKKLGYEIDVAPQNMADVGPFPGGGFISCGDRYGNKQSTPETYLKDAATAPVAAKFADRCQVETVLHQGGAAKGIRARIVGADGVTEHILTVTAPTVVVSCGSLNSPALLLRSRLPDPYRQIGKNLRLHPVTGIVGIMPKEVNLWRGAPMTAVSNECAAGRGDNYGAKLECPIAHPGIFSSIVPWKDGAAFKEVMLDYRRTAAIIVLTRDKGSGEVTIDRTGMARLSYKLADHDRQSLLEGAEKALRILEAAGAEKIGVGQLNEPVLLPPLSEAKARAARLEKLIEEVRHIGFPLYKVPLFSAHQMGTCRMGTDPRNSVVKPTCETWACSGLYVVDASTFPTSSGANPMITTLGIAHMAAQRLKKLSSTSSSRL
mmetsp:Transcript_101273/g.179956  ORF Transcript_101273/g.179956 Transcript_101273/m.179956 type:complete len:718 (-) Transcript_101273:86-2239(-)